MTQPVTRRRRALGWSPSPTYEEDSRPCLSTSTAPPRTDLLADELGKLLTTPLDDPFATEVVVVPTRGMERWLSPAVVPSARQQRGP